MDPLTWFLLISAGVSAVAGGIAQKKSVQTAKRNTDLTILANQKNAELAFERDKEQLAYQNQYNTPEAQMARFKKAGLNPNLIYSQGNPGNQTTIARYQAPNVQYNYKPFDVTAITKPLTDLPQQFLQAKILYNQGEISKSQASIQKSIAEFARTKQITELSMTMTQKRMLEKLELMNLAEFESLFQASKNSVGGMSWELRPGMSEKFLEYMLGKLAQPMANVTSTTTSTEFQKMQNDMYKSMKIIGTAMPALNPLLDAIKLYYFGAKSSK